MISGYLITAIIRKEIAEERFSLTDFYRRRIVRILPALLLMLGVVLVVGCFTQFPIPLRELGQSTAAAAAFGSNIFFYATSDYFARASDLKPLIHTWSLAVEEQFYLLYPLLLLSLRRLSPKALAAVMIGLAAASLAIGGYFAAVEPWAGFYLLPARIWELLLGGLVALGVYPRIENARLREFACWFALAAIAASAVFMKPSWPFPVPFAIAPAGGAALLLAYSSHTRAAQLLSWAPMRAIGLISYSLYLWHRPIIATYFVGRSWTASVSDTLILLALSFTVAILSYTLVERPALRRWRSGSGLVPHAVAGLAMLAIAGAGLAVAASAERLRSLPPPVARVVGYLGFDKTPAGTAQYRTGTCFALPYREPFDPKCLVPAPDRTNVLLVGDSHAAQLSSALAAQIAPAHLMQATSAGCRPLLVTTGFPGCRKISLEALERTDLSRVATVVLAGRWFPEDLAPLLDTIRSLRQRGVPKVVVVGPMVEYEADVPELLGHAMLANDLSLMPRSRLPDREPLDRMMQPAVTAAGARYVSHFAIECPGGVCKLFTSDGAPLHADQSHLTPQAAVPVARRIAQEAGLR